MKLCECGCGLPTPPASRNFPSRGWIKGEPIRLLKSHRIRIPLSDRFWDKVNKNGPVPPHCSELGPCWLWTGAQDGKGRGSVWVDEVGTKCKAHRVAWYLETGMWPNPMALHKCDNGLCVRFSHLFEGTQKVNMQDAKEKGRTRNGTVRGEDNNNAVLTDAQAKEVKAFLANGFVGADLAKSYGVSVSTISHIKTGKAWKHI